MATLKIKLGYEEAVMLGALIEQWMEQSALLKPDYTREMEAYILERVQKKILVMYNGRKPRTFTFDQAEINVVYKTLELMGNHAGPALLCQ